MAGRKWPPFEERFWARVQKSDGCWIWTGNKTPQGYGSTYNAGYYEGRREHAHRISYRMAYGDFPREMLVCHKCDNPPCVRPDHLFLGTANDNQQDAKNKNRLPTGDRHWSHRRPDLVPKGHKRPYAIWSRGSKNPQSKLTEQDILYIRELAHLKVKYRTIAKAFNVSDDSVEKIIHRKSWKHI